ncbi:kinase phosphorylation protein-domain-containing protein [Paraphoma chrysanthemicola]|uniref:Kinase phosphorylation protein-domain-containing protein n=1 Tax=Paraphoma chrysanthemicola TaxID=798071 RepID=A0A8K0RC35_9PLEO|nr:kinase phosphorylation protein-domain-containing protein [Paraphoma chrysanthemicola]
MDLVQTVRKEGSRGGRAEFKWEDVKGDAQRENYLGHSLMAPVGRWQQGRDLNWYAKGDGDSKEAEAERIKEEKRKLKEAEEDAMLAAMGLPVPVRDNANLTPLGQKAHEADVEDAMEDKAKAEEETDRAGRKEKKEKSRRHRDDDRERKRRHRSRSRGDTTRETTGAGIVQGVASTRGGMNGQNIEERAMHTMTVRDHVQETGGAGEAQEAGRRSQDSTREIESPLESVTPLPTKNHYLGLSLLQC